MSKTGKAMVAIVGVLFALTTMLVLAADAPKLPEPAKAAPAANSAQPAKKVQEKCPVMGEPINKKIFVDKGGKRIYVCCSKCSDAVKKDFDKYAKQLEAEGIDLTIPKGTAKTDSAKPAAAKPAAKPEPAKPGAAQPEAKK